MNTPEQVIIFGASGDLTRRKLIPALARLEADPGPPGGFSVLGVSRSPMTDAEFRAHLAEGMSPELRAAFDQLAPRIFYHAADTSDSEALSGLARRLDELPGGRQSGRLFYLSLKPELFPIVVDRMGSTGLLNAWDAEEGFRRVVVEKPFGSDLESARKLNRELYRTLQEEQIYRIDHYLGKETVQNLLGFRFHNAIFEPLWNRHHVDFVEITVAETLGVENGRGAYYDDTGALRDMVQNHMLQVLALIAMEPPATLDADAVRSQKVELLRALRHPPNRPGQISLIRARYGKGTDGKTRVGAYLDEEGVARDSETETYVALRAQIENWRWSGVPFYLRHGKRMRERYTEVKVQFHTPPLQLFGQPSESTSQERGARETDDESVGVGPNTLVLRIQPEEKIWLTFGVKRPGNTMNMEQAELLFDYKKHFGASSPDAYVRLLADAIAGDQTLFLRGDEIEASWEYADSVRKAWQESEVDPILEYPAGSWGPEEANALFADEEGEWSRGRDESS